MDFQKQALTYVLLIIPLFFAGTMFVQGFQKLSRHESDGKVAIGFGVFFLILIVVTYVLFIR